MICAMIRTMDRKKLKKIRNLLQIIFIILLAVILIYAIVKFIPDIVGLLKNGNEQEMQEYIEGAGKKGVFVLAALQVLQTITIIFPGIPIYMCAGIVYGKIKADVGKILRELSERKGVEILEAECCPDHIHMLVAIPPHLSVAQYMGYLKSKSSLMIFDRHANLKYKYGNRHFWCRGYYVDTVGKYEGAIKEYIRNQLQEDIANDQISLKEFVDPFTGDPVKQGK